MNTEQQDSAKGAQKKALDAVREAKLEADARAAEAEGEKVEEEISSALIVLPEDDDESALVASSPQPSTVSPLFSLSMQLASVEEQERHLVEWDRRRTHFFDWLMSKLKEGVHYGFPPGTNRPGDRTDPKEWTKRRSFYDAGARLMMDLFMLSDHYDYDTEAWKMHGSKQGHVCLKCTLTARATGEIVGVGHGSVEEGENKRHTANSRTKVAKKRARVDSVLVAFPMLTDVFTQDMEDGDPEKLRANVDKHERQGKQASGSKASDQERKRKQRDDAKPWRKEAWSDEQRDAMCRYATDSRLSDDQRAWVQKKLADWREEPAKLNRGWACDAIEALKMKLVNNKYNDPDAPPAHIYLGDDGRCAACGAAVEPEPTPEVDLPEDDGIDLPPSELPEQEAEAPQEEAREPGEEG